jgi:HAD superfamily hydrolase (TIGR01509 family)
VIEAVLFDGDQTLWDFQQVMEYALDQVLAEIRVARPGSMADQMGHQDLSADRDQINREFGGQEFNLARLRHLGFRRTLLRIREAGFPSTETDDDTLADELTASYFRHRDLNPALFPDTFPGLSALRSDFRLGLLSNGSRLPDAVGLGDFFEVVVFAQDHQVAKPDVGIFRIVESLLNLGPESLVLIGDHPHNDVVGAKQAGWRAIWIDRDNRGTFRPPTGYTDQPDAVVTSLDQLPGVLSAL